MNCLFILGSHPKLSIAEILRTLGKKIEIVNATDVAVFAVVPDDTDVSALQTQLGGTVKIAVPLFETASTPTADSIMKHLEPSGEGKWQFGFSLYGKQGNFRRAWDRLGIDLKKAWRAEGRSVRFVTTRESILSSIVVQKEGMLTRGADICVIDGPIAMTIARTVASQDPRELAKRDYGKARRPTRVGMLPIKLAKIMLNLAAQPADAKILDPFMGSGTVLTEALLAGHAPTQLLGSDLAERAVEHTRENLSAASLPSLELRAIDACELEMVFKPNTFDAIVTEGHLGLPKSDADRRRYQKEMEELYTKALKSLAVILKPTGVIVMAFPAYLMDNKQILALNLAPAFKEAGLRPHLFTEYANLQTDRGSLVYGRPTQRVWRDIYILHKN